MMQLPKCDDGSVSTQAATNLCIVFIFFFFNFFAVVCPIRMLL